MNTFAIRFKFHPMRTALFLICFMLYFFTSAQTPGERNKIKAQTRVNYLKTLAKTKNKQYLKKQAELQRKARKKGWKTGTFLQNGTYKELVDTTRHGTPVYYISHNADAAISTRANRLHSGGGSGLETEGRNLTVYIWDWGHANFSHAEYKDDSGQSRVISADPHTELNAHAAHVTGTIIASGIEAEAKGMAPQAVAVNYKWNNDVFEAATEAAAGMLISNHSYGYAAGTIDDDWFGQYGQDAANWDEVMFNAPYYLMVVSGGNDGNNSSDNAVPLDENSQYDKLSGHKTAKNNLVVANAKDADIDEQGNLISAQIHSTSSQGPTDDYRIKPDITGNGTQLYSTLGTGYGNNSGTSMAASNVSGSLLLLQEHFYNSRGRYMTAASLKGLVLHTADDLGQEGPDAVYGYGLLNVREAAFLISGHGNTSIIEEKVLNEGQTHTFQVESDTTNDLLVSVSWTDPPAEVNQNLNDTTPMLTDDLDLRVSQDSQSYEPYLLTAVNVTDRGDNRRDPYEKVIIPEAEGNYEITVSHKNNLSGGSRNYSLIISGIVNQAPEIAKVSPASFFADRGKLLHITGNGLLGCEYKIKNIEGELLNFSEAGASVKFPPADYSDSVLEVSNPLGSDTETMLINTRNVIPTNASADENSDEHPDLQSALDGMQAWLKTSIYTRTYTVEISEGTYEGGTVFNSEMEPTADYPLIIKNAEGDSPVITAQNCDYGLNISGLKHTFIQGFTIHSATKDNLKVQGENITIAYNQLFGAQEGSGINITQSSDITVHNNLSYNNFTNGLALDAQNARLKNNTLCRNGGSYSPNLQSRIFYDDFESGIQAWESTDDIYLYGSEDEQFYVSENTSLYIYGASDLYIYTKNPLDISGYDNLKVSAYLRFNLSGTIEEADTIRFQYSFDDENWTEAAELTTDDSGIDEFQKYETPGISPESDKLYLRFYVLVNDAEGHWDESWIIDDVEVKGDENFEAYSAGAALFLAEGSTLQAENNILTAKSGDDDFFAVETEGSFSATSAYNTYFSENQYLFSCSDISDNESLLGKRDITADPQFVEAEADYHLSAPAGSYHGGEWPPISADSGTWTADNFFSPAIDNANPEDDYFLEPQGGNARNQGAYGNTPQASGSSILNVTAEPTTVHVGDSVQLHAEAEFGADSYTYSWTADPGGYFSELADPLVYPDSSAGYTVTLEDPYGRKLTGSTEVKVMYKINGKLIYADENFTPLSDQSVRIYSSENELIDECITNNEGIFEFTDLRPEAYNVLPVVATDWRGVTALDITMYKQGMENPSALDSLVFFSGDFDDNAVTNEQDIKFWQDFLSEQENNYPIRNCVYENCLLEISDANINRNIRLLYAGDANASFHTDDAFLSDISINPADKVFAEKNDTFEIALTVDNDIRNLASISFELNYRADLADVFALSGNENASDWWWGISNDTLKVFYATTDDADVQAGDTLLFVSAGLKKDITEEQPFFISACGEFADKDHNVIKPIEISAPLLMPESTVQSNDFFDKLKVYPNPTKGKLIVNFRSASYGIHIGLEDIYGRVLRENHHISDDYWQTDINDFPAGIYFLKISKDENRHTKIIIKQ